MSTRVVNIKHDHYDEFIGRPTLFGNPFKIGKSCTRAEAIEAFKTYFYNRLKTDAQFSMSVDALKGKVLGCYCKPEDCHGDTIAEYLNRR